jgi:hypothetical protein
MKRLIFGLLLFLPVSAVAQVSPFSSKAQREFANALTAGSIFGSPRYTTAALPLCDGSAGGLLNTGAVAYDTTAATLKFCTGSAWTSAGGGVSGGANNVIAKWTGAATLGNSSLTDNGTVVTGTEPFQLGNGSTGAPTYSFSNFTNYGVNAQNGALNFVVGGANQFFTGNSPRVVGLGNAVILGWTSTSDPLGGGTDTQLARGGTDGALRIFGGTTPTISSGFGTSPAVTASGSNSLFQVNVGTGGAATSGVIAFHGTWTNAPYCFVNDETSQAITNTAVATTTQVTLTATAAWTASSKLDVFCVSQ